MNLKDEDETDEDKDDNDKLSIRLIVKWIDKGNSLVENGIKVNE